VNVRTGSAVHCYVCNSDEQYNGAACDSETLDKSLLVNCSDEEHNDGKNYTMCRKFIQDGKYGPTYRRRMSLQPYSR